MCSFIFSDKNINNLEEVNFFNKFRGPDYTNLFNCDGYSFVHNLLSITGDFTLQPFVKEDIICLYNGEIYEFEKMVQRTYIRNAFRDNNPVIDCAHFDLVFVMGTRL